MTASQVLAMRAAAAAAIIALCPFPARAGTAPSQASRLLGTPAVDSRGRSVGEVTDLIVDFDKARVVAIVVERGTASGADVRRVFAVPGPKERDGKLVVDAAAAPTAEPSSGAATLAFTDIKRAPLRDAEGHEAGHIADLMVGLDDARVASVVIRFDPDWLDMDALAAVAPSSVERKGDGFLAKFRSSDVRASSPSAKHVRITVPKHAAPAPSPRARLARLAGARIVDTGGKAVAVVDDALIDTGARRVAALVVRAGDRKVRVAFPQQGLHFDAGRIVSASSVDGLATVSATGLVSARRVLDMRIRSSEGHDVGEVKDVVVDMGSGNLQFAVARFDPSWVAPDWLVALPLRAATPDEGGALAMRFELYEINGAYLFKAKSWPDFSDAAVRAAIHARIDRM